MAPRGTGASGTICGGSHADAASRLRRRRLSVYQRPWGALATSRAPRGARPWVRVTTVLAQPSAIKLSRATVGRSCPAFFYDASVTNWPLQTDSRNLVCFLHGV